jgi:hypothetical protein
MKRLIASVILFTVSAVIWTHAGAIQNALSQISPDQSKRSAMSAALARYGSCKLNIALIDQDTGEVIPGLVRVSMQIAPQTWMPLEGLIPRVNQGWHVLTEATTVQVPQQLLRIEAIQGIETELALVDVDLSRKYDSSLNIPLKRFYNTHQKGLLSGNTHLHLENITKLQADRYLQEVPRADQLDIVFVSYLHSHWKMKELTTNVYGPKSLAGLSTPDILLRWGEEHRHNFLPRHEEGYGHVMFLDVNTLVEPVSIGPALGPPDSPEGIPLQRGIRKAREDGATVVWCHNRRGYEDIPNWILGDIDAQNIFDNGSMKRIANGVQGTGLYRDSFYRYYNIGMHIPFSTGTDFLLFDFSRVYVPGRSPLSSDAWLQGLRDGKSFITNGPLLEFSINGLGIGETLNLDQPETIRVTARGIGRSDFSALELIFNGNVVYTASNRPVEGHFEAEIDRELNVSEPGWFALRIPWEAPTNQNLFDRDLFAHTSPIYIQIAGKQIFKPEVAQGLIDEMMQSIDVLSEKVKFQNTQRRTDVLRVYQQAIEALKRKIDALE